MSGPNKRVVARMGNRYAVLHVRLMLNLSEAINLVEQMTHEDLIDDEPTVAAEALEDLKAIRGELRAMKGGAFRPQSPFDVSELKRERLAARGV